jgi:hypothetical protein
VNEKIAHENRPSTENYRIKIKLCERIPMTLSSCGPLMLIYVRETSLWPTLVQLCSFVLLFCPLSVARPSVLCAALSFVPFVGPNKRVAFDLVTLHACLPVSAAQQQQTAAAAGRPTDSSSRRTDGQTDSRRQQTTQERKRQGQGMCGRTVGASVCATVLSLGSAAGPSARLSSELTEPVRQSSPLSHVGFLCVLLFVLAPRSL